jgi:hypothetical protein
MRGPDSDRSIGNHSSRIVYSPDWMTTVRMTLAERTDRQSLRAWRSKRVRFCSSSHRREFILGGGVLGIWLTRDRTWRGSINPNNSFVLSQSRFAAIQFAGNNDAVECIWKRGCWQEGFWVCDRDKGRKGDYVSVVRMFLRG